MNNVVLSSKPQTAHAWVNPRRLMYRCIDRVNPSTRFYRATLRVARYCQGKLSVRLSVRLSVTLRYRGHIGWNSWKNNFTADKPDLFALCRHQQDGSTPKGTPQILAGIHCRSGVGKLSIFAI